MGRLLVRRLGRAGEEAHRAEARQGRIDRPDARAGGARASQEDGHGGSRGARGANDRGGGGAALRGEPPGARSGADDGAGLRGDGSQPLRAVLRRDEHRSDHRRRHRGLHGAEAQGGPRAEVDLDRPGDSLLDLSPCDPAGLADAAGESGGRGGEAEDPAPLGEVQVLRPGGVRGAAARLPRHRDRPAGPGHVPGRRHVRASPGRAARPALVLGRLVGDEAAGRARHLHPRAHEGERQERGRRQGRADDRAGCARARASLPALAVHGARRTWCSRTRSPGGHSSVGRCIGG